MIRCTIEMIPGGIEDHPRRRVIGVVEIANNGKGTETHGDYLCRATKRDGKTPWKFGSVEDFPRKRLGPYDLLYRALAACGMKERNA